MTGIMMAVAAGDGSSGSSAAFTPAPGNYQVSDNGPGGWSAIFTVTATAPVVWYFTAGADVIASVPSGTSASSITFEVEQGVKDKARTVNLSANSSSWSITMYVSGDPTI